MPFITYQCRVCQKNVTEVSHFSLSGKLIRKLSCGHSQIDEVIIPTQEKDISEITAITGKKLFPFQIKGVVHAEKANLCALNADEMGLGKTYQLLLAIKQHKESLPCAIICKSSLKAQWSLAIAEWFGVETTRITINTSKDLFPRVQFYIFSFDILRRFVKKQKVRNLQGELVEVENYDALIKIFTDNGIKSIIIDECQHIKNHESSRSRAVRAIAANCRYKLAASGTPIKNNASEYFPILNILKPELFKTFQGFVHDWCDNYWTGYNYKVAGIRNIEKFNDFTKDFIIRRTRDEVELDFPERNRSYHYYDLGDEVQQAYDETLDELSDYMDGSHSSFEQATNILKYLNIMRHLTGLSKVDDCVDFVDDFINSTDRKIVIFVHHIDVGDLLQNKLNTLIKNLNEMFGRHYSKPYRMYGGQAEKIFQIGEDFQADENARVLIAPTLAAGEGLNLQQVGDCIILEREWNPPNEEQAEGRFIRIGSTHKTVAVNYMIALGTVDHKFTDIVEKKRSIISSTLDGKSYNWNETEIIKELATELVKARNKKRGNI